MRTAPAGPAPTAAGPGGVGDALAAWLLGTATGIVTVVHLGASLAAVVFGTGSLRATFGDSAGALLGLPRHLADPATAWPPAARQSLPGPVALWASIATVLLAAVGIGLGLWALRRRLAGDAPNALGIRPDAGFARSRDLRRLAVAEPEVGRLTLGTCRRQLLAAEAQASLAVVGPTGCGKTAGFAIPALLEWKGPVIATSVKADLLAATIAHRSKAGTVWVYDPTGASGYEPAASWSPLSACVTWAGAIRIAAWLAEAAQPRFDTVSDGDYWYSQARKGLAPYLHAAALSGDRTMTDVVRWVDSQERAEVEAPLRDTSGLEAALAEAMASPEADDRRAKRREEVRTQTIDRIRWVLRDDPGGRAAIANRPVPSWPVLMQEQLDERVETELDAVVRGDFESELMAAFSSADRLAPLIAARSLWERDGRLRDSVFATMQNILAGYADPGVGAAAQRSETSHIDLEAWLAGDNTIYVVATAHEQIRLRPVLTVLVQQAIRAAYDTASARGGTLEHPALVLLDEAGNTAPLRDLPGYASTARSHGITLVSVWQDLAQVRAIYHDRAQTVLNNHRAKLFGTGIADESTLDYVSRLVGDEARTERNLSADLSGGRRTMSEHTAYRRVAPVDVLRRIRPDQAVLVYGSELPVHLRLRPWFNDSGLKKLARADAPPTQADAFQSSAGGRLRARLRR